MCPAPVEREVAPDPAVGASGLEGETGGQMPVRRHRGVAPGAQIPGGMGQARSLCRLLPSRPVRPRRKWGHNFQGAREASSLRRTI